MENGGGHRSSVIVFFFNGVVEKHKLHTFSMDQVYSDVTKLVCIVKNYGFEDPINTIDPRIEKNRTYCGDVNGCNQTDFRLLSLPSILCPQGCGNAPSQQTRSHSIADEPFDEGLCPIGQ